MQPNPQASAHPGAKFNALKHGLHAETTVLPDEDLEAFRLARQIAFLEFRPQTVDEAELVDELVDCRWQMKRCRGRQAEADAQSAHPERDAANRLAEPLTHQRTHTTMDVTIHHDRIDKRESRNRAKLRESQRMRRLGLMQGAVKLPPDCYIEVNGEVVQVVDTPRAPVRVCRVADVLPQATRSIQAPQTETDKTAVTRSTDRADGFSTEQKETGGETARFGSIPSRPVFTETPWSVLPTTDVSSAGRFADGVAMAR